MTPSQRCDLCELNRASLHLDEPVGESEVRTAHLCNDCWYRLGVRIPLGNIWEHIKRAKSQRPGPPLEDGLEDVLEALAEGPETQDDEEDLGELLNQSDVAIAEPDPPLSDTVHQAFETEAGTHAPPPEDPLLSDLPLGGRRDRSEAGPPLVPVRNVHAILVGLLPLEVWQSSAALPVQLDGHKVTVAFADPGDTEKVTQIRKELSHHGLTLDIAQGMADEIRRELERHQSPPPPYNSLS